MAGTRLRDLLVELETAGLIERKRLYAGNLKSKRILRCLKYVSMDGFSAHRPDGRVFGQPKISPISLPSQSHPSPIQKKEESSLPLPGEPETSERIM